MSKLQAVSPRTVVSINVYPGSCNVGGVALEEFTIAIDGTHSPLDGKDFREELEKYFQLPVKYLFLTHTHTDHRNGIPAFKDLTILSSERTANHMPKTVKWKDLNTITFDKKYEIKGTDTLKVELHRIGGHSIGSSILYFPSEKVIFAGDLIVEFVPLAIDRTFNPDELITGLERIKSMDVEKIVPGHSWFFKVFYTKMELEEQIILLRTLRSYVMEAHEDNRKFNDLTMPQSDFLEDLEAKIPTSPIAWQKKTTRQIKSSKQYLLKKMFYFYKEHSL